jgi:hypothetical protein
LGLKIGLEEFGRANVLEDGVAKMQAAENRLRFANYSAWFEENR